MSTHSPPPTDAATALLRPSPPGLGHKLRAALGREQFGRPSGPWRALMAPVPLAAVLLFLAHGLLLPAGSWDWASRRLGEISWLLWAPFAIATAGQAIAMGLSATRWRETEGEQHLDYSPRAWHYALAAIAAALPLVLLQGCPTFLDAYLALQLRLVSAFGHAAAHVGYDPDWSNLMVLGVLPLVGWQVRRLLAAIPCGRLLGLQRELARLRSAVAWEPEAWEGAVADTFERWFEDLLPAVTTAAPTVGRARRLRQRWGALRREIVLSFLPSPPDLLRANRALALFRQST